MASVIQNSVALQILAYLAKHSRSQDTVEGITEWWLLEQQVVSAVQTVERALAQLVQRQWIIARLDKDGRRHYRMNLEKEHEIHRLLDRGAKKSAVQRSLRKRSRRPKK
jgi:hypothetical protein